MPRAPIVVTFAHGIHALQAREQLGAQGYREVGVGDWSWVLSAPGDAMVAKVCPWDPAYRLFAEHCLAAPRLRHLPKLHRIIPLRDPGFIVLMERLHPCEESLADDFCAALGLSRGLENEPNEPDSRVDPPQPNPFAGSAEIEKLRHWLTRLIDKGSLTLPFWGGADIRPGNLLQDDDGVIKLIDPIFVQGRKIAAAIDRGAVGELQSIRYECLQAFLTIPVFASGAEAQAFVARARDFLAAARLEFDLKSHD